MATNTSAPVKRIPSTIKRFSSSAAHVTIKKWPDREANGDHPAEAGGVFIEISQDTGKVDAQQKAIWTRVQFELADVSGVIETLNRAKTLGIQSEDSR